MLAQWPYLPPMRLYRSHLHRPRQRSVPQDPHRDNERTARVALRVLPQAVLGAHRDRPARLEDRARKWILVFFEMASSKNGVAAREIERKYELTPKSAWFMIHRIREAMKATGFIKMINTTVVADEAYIGGMDKNKHADKRIHKSGRTTDKAIVFTLIDGERGEARSAVVPNITGATLGRRFFAMPTRPVPCSPPTNTSPISGWARSSPSTSVLTTKRISMSATGSSPTSLRTSSAI